MKMAEFRMMLFIFFIAVIPSVLAYDQDKENLRSIMKLLNTPQIPERYVPGETRKLLQPDIPRLTQYSWKSCGPADPVQANLVLSPDPLPIPGNVTIAGYANLTQDVVSPVKLVLSIQKKVLVWIPIPCVDDVGSCTYDDLCEMLAESFPPSEPCPEPFASHNLPCNCPFKAGSYTLPPSQVTVETTGLPSWLTSGDYKVHAVASDSSGKELACFDVMLTLK